MVFLNLSKSFCNDNTIEYQVDYSNPESINSLFNRIHLECESKKKIGLIGSSLFMGLGLSCLVVLRISDIYGRKVLATIGNALILVFYCTFLNLKSIEMTIAIYFLGGIGVSMGFVL